MNFKNLFIKWAYNDSYKDFFNNNKDKINTINASSLNTLNNVAVIVFGIYCIYGYFSIKYSNLFYVYLIYFLLFAAIKLLCKHIQTYFHTLPSQFLYVIISFLYIFGIYIGCINLPNITSVMYPVFVISLPLLFVLPTINITAFTLITTLIYIFISKSLKSDDIAFIDITNIIACTLISAVTSYTVTSSRLKEINANMRLERICNTDELTGLHNRRSFNNFIVNIFDNFEYQNLALMMIDIDNFKAYNDTYGHIAGDNCLIILGKVFKDFELKYNCYISRYGGEEFVLIDYKHTFLEVELLAKELIKMIYNMNIENINSEYKKITISIGISSKSTSDAETYIDLINLADDALYQAKNNGRNTLMIARHSMNGMNDIN